MNRGVYSAAIGMLASMTRLDVVAQNLANVGTSGYKRDGITFAERLAKQLRASGGAGDPIGTLGAGSSPVSTYTDFTQGAIQNTGNPLDVAILGDEGMFATAGPNGSTLYTRAGSFTRLATGELATSTGAPVLDEQGQTILLPAGEVEIDAEGFVLADGAPVARLGLVTGTFRKSPGGGATFTSNDAVSAWSANREPISLQPRAVEGANVNPVAEMVDMIALNRSFELAQRMATSQDEASSRLIQGILGR